jgi:hypothetical protein
MADHALFDFTVPDELLKEAAGHSRDREAVADLELVPGTGEGKPPSMLGVLGRSLAYRTDVFHRAVDLVEPGGARFLLNVSFKTPGQDWIGFHAGQSAANSPDWTAFVEGSTPEELTLFGFPPPGHPIWDEPLIAATAERYSRAGLDALARCAPRSQERSGLNAPSTSRPLGRPAPVRP